MLISLPARVGYLYSSTSRSSPHLAQHMFLRALTGLITTCKYIACSRGRGVLASVQLGR